MLSPRQHLFLPPVRVNPSCTYHQKQIHIIQPQLIQTLLQPQLAPRRVRSPHLAHDKHILALEARGKRLGQALSDLVLVAVAVGPIDQPVADLEGVRDCGLDFAGFALPCACWSVFSV